MLGTNIIGLIIFTCVIGLMVKQNHIRSLQRLGATSRASANERVFTAAVFVFLFPFVSICLSASRAYICRQCAS